MPLPPLPPLANPTATTSTRMKSKATLTRMTSKVTPTTTIRTRTSPKSDHPKGRDVAPRRLQPQRRSLAADINVVDLLAAVSHVY